jgi:EAL domain-containing protein (putative c-di-GMP-specific phosphodiesterase class I)
MKTMNAATLENFTNQSAESANPYLETLKYLNDSDSGLMAEWNNLKIRSAFQPIVSLNHAKVVGYEALMRPTTITDHPLSPVAVIKSYTNRSDAIFLDRLCRSLHLNSFKRFSLENTWLFVNVSPETIVHGSNYGEFFIQLVESSGILPEHIVIEILETSLSDEKDLSHAINFYKNLGCLVAIDDFGAGHSNFHRIWRLKPNIVKLDRSLISSAVTNPSAGRILPGMVSLLHEAGCLVLIEGIENEAEAYTALESGSDLAQGWYFGVPNSEMDYTYKIKNKISKLQDDYRYLSNLDKLESKYENEVLALKNAANDLIPEEPFLIESQSAIQNLMSLLRAERCYLLDEFGFQVSKSVLNANANYKPSSQFSPIDDGMGANWSHRIYMQRAIEHIGNVQITRPYLSIATAKMCTTLSLAFKFRGRIHVICLDITFQD